MGKSSKPLSLYLDIEIEDWPEFNKLWDQGFTRVMTPLTADLCIGPRMWNMDESLREYLPLALAAARKRRYPKEVSE